MPRLYSSDMTTRHFAVMKAGIGKHFQLHLLNIRNRLPTAKGRQACGKPVIFCRLCSNAIVFLRETCLTFVHCSCGMYLSCYKVEWSNSHEKCYTHFRICTTLWFQPDGYSEDSIKQREIKIKYGTNSRGNPRSSRFVLFESILVLSCYPPHSGNIWNDYAKDCILEFNRITRNKTIQSYTFNFQSRLIFWVYHHYCLFVF